MGVSRLGRFVRGLGCGVRRLRTRRLGNRPHARVCRDVIVERAAIWRRVRLVVASCLPQRELAVSRNSGLARRSPDSVLSHDVHLHHAIVMTPPRRRWYQFSLATLFVVVTVVAIAVWQVMDYRQGNTLVSVATTWWIGDPRIPQAVSQDLENHGIDCTWHGDANVFHLSVHRRDEKLARKILRESPPLRKYSIQLEPAPVPGSTSLP
jgi:hypothetical protein